jgi:hypothetical protein
MYVVGHSASLEQVSFLPSNDPADVSVKFVLKMWIDQRATMLRGEDEMIKQVCVRARHRSAISKCRRIRGCAMGCVIPVSSGPIVGETLMGVAVKLWMAALALVQQLLKVFGKSL